MKLKLSRLVRSELESKCRCRSLPAEDVRRADIILRLAGGQSQRGVARELRCGINTVRLWAGRFQAEGLAGLDARHAGRELPEETPALEARILK